MKSVTAGKTRPARLGPHVAVDMAIEKESMGGSAEGIGMTKLTADET